MVKSLLYLPKTVFEFKRQAFIYSNYRKNRFSTVLNFSLEPGIVDNTLQILSYVSSVS